MLKPKKLNAKKWLKKKEFTVWQAACLCQGIEPPKTFDKFCKLLDTNEQLKHVYEEMKKAILSGELKATTKLSA